MNKLAVVLAGLLAFNLSAQIKPQHLNAAVSVKWQNPDKYRDVKSANGIQKRYRQQVLDSLERYLHQELAKVIASGQKVEVTVYNLDLAGDVLPMVIDHRDMGFNSGSNSLHRGDELHYEKAMLKKWIRRQVKS